MLRSQTIEPTGRDGHRAPGVALMNLGIVEMWSGRYDDAERHLSEEPSLPRRSAGRLGGGVFVRTTFPDKNVSVASARERGRQTIALAKRYGLGESADTCAALGALAGWAIWTGEFDEAERWLRRAWEVSGHESIPSRTRLCTRRLASCTPVAGSIKRRWRNSPRARGQALLTGAHCSATRTAAWLRPRRLVWDARRGARHARRSLRRIRRTGPIYNARAVICMAEGIPWALDVLRDVRASHPRWPRLHVR